MVTDTVNQTKSCPRVEASRPRLSFRAANAIRQIEDNSYYQFVTAITAPSPLVGNRTRSETKQLRVGGGVT